MGDIVVLIVPVFLKIALEVDIYGKLRLWNEPYRTAGEPVIGKFGLPAVLQLLLENTVLIADGMTHSRESCCSQTVEVAGSKSAETAVSETCIRLVLIYLIQIYIIIFEHSLDIVSQL